MGDSKAKNTFVSAHYPVFVSPGVAYQPRNFSPEATPSVPSQEQVVEDLRLLRATGFHSLVTYGAQNVLGLIPKLAREQGFSGKIIMGIWDPFSKEEWDNSVAQAPFVDGYCLGNEGLGVRYSPDVLAFKMSVLRRETGRPVTTSEPIDSYLGGPYREWLLAHSDWLFPLAQPFWSAKTIPTQAVDWIVGRHDYLTATTKRQVILKEAGLPTAGEKSLSEEGQRLFFEKLESADVWFFYFEAFDQPWKPAHRKLPEVEAYWGIYRTDGTPKEVISWLLRR